MFFCNIHVYESSSTVSVLEPDQLGLPSKRLKRGLFQGVLEEKENIILTVKPNMRGLFAGCVNVGTMPRTKVKVKVKFNYTTRID